MSRKAMNDVIQYVRDVFGVDVEIVDAKAPISLVPLAIDLEGADPKTPNNCFLVHTARRMFGAKAAVFWKKSAYIDMPDGRGKRVVRRWISSKSITDTVAKIDRGETWIEGSHITLFAPTYNNRRDVRRRKHRAYRRSPIGQAVMQFHAAQRTARLAEVSLDKTKEKLAEARRDERSASPRLQVAIRLERNAHKAVQTAREKVNNLKAKAEKLGWKGHGKSPRTAFDLTTRNGAIGNYHFVPAELGING